jgi:hypothetical protein
MPPPLRASTTANIGTQAAPEQRVQLVQLLEPEPTLA